MNFDEATRAQVDASNPTASTWLTANAGSGKTKVLTDRVARLLLLGVDPQSILCLTYTKAAAAEMQNRLFKRLGEWAMLPEADLSAALALAGIEGKPNLRQARTLFARAIEVPGGLKIQTIHAFAASILRRFPIEAGISPDFRELDEDEAGVLRRETVDALAHERPEVIAHIARFVSDDDLDTLARAVSDKRDAFPSEVSRENLCEGLGVDPSDTPHSLLAQLMGTDGASILQCLKSALSQGSSNDAKALEKIERVNPDAPNPADHALLESIFLYGAKTKAPFGAKVGKFPTAASRTVMGDAASALDAFMERAEALREPRLALEALDRSLALHRFAAAFLPAYARAKAQRGTLDFDDLIARAGALLDNGEIASWILYRIDGDIEHLLVDEAQDTSPEQWDLIDKLTQELAAGQGADTIIPRSIFVVGDLKQSIYSFQGADPREMTRMSDHYQSRLRGAFRRRDLQFSFRSSSAILRVVDATFAPLEGQGIGTGAAHAAFHDTLPGRVDIWPVDEPIDEPDSPEWYDPCDIVRPTDPVMRLSKKIAAEISGWVQTETIPAQNGRSRRVEAKDVLILFKRRNALFHQTIRACKEAGLAVAGADRVLLQEELAVKDIMSVMSFLALPEDDLALAEALRSPLFGWDEQDLFRLANGRGEAFLWQALRKQKDVYPETFRILEDLRNQADYLRPYETIDRLLTRHGGRSKLLARLGDEAEDGIDALLAQAMQYEASRTPSLTGFLGWYASSEIEIKRQAGSAEAGIRVMTVHGAKGLESPIVILPDTLSDRTRTDVLMHTRGRAPHLYTSQDQRPDVLAGIGLANAETDEHERQRLLYVAMTRAETWLVVAGAGQKPTNGKSWYELVENGVSAAGSTIPIELADGSKARRFQEHKWTNALGFETIKTPERLALPKWLDTPRAAPSRPESTVSPSSLGGAKALPGESGVESDVALAYGTALHLLLERLPDVQTNKREENAETLLSDQPVGLRKRAIEDALRLLSDPNLAHLFSPETLAEVEFAVQPAVFGGKLLSGSIDRLIVEEDSVTAVDFKSNREVPNTAAETPEGILRQMAAYSAALSETYPDRKIETAVLWTRTGELMALPHDIVREALQRAAIS